MYNDRSAGRWKKLPITRTVYIKYWVLKEHAVETRMDAGGPSHRASEGSRSVNRLALCMQYILKSPTFDDIQDSAVN